MGVQRTRLLTCETCGAGFSPDHGNPQRFCSRRCFGESLRGRRRPELHKTPHRTKCERCLRWFSFKGATDRRFCSRACFRDSVRHTNVCEICGGPVAARARRFCSREHWAIAYRRDRGIEKSCERCGETFRTTRRAASRRRFCRDDCRKAWWEERIEVVCEKCGESFKRSRSRARTTRFCSNGCRLAWLLLRRTSEIERNVGVALRSFGYDLLPQERLHGFFVDYAISSLRVVVEVDGDYWHSSVAARRRDRAEDRILGLHGWKVVRTRESDLRKDWSGECLRLKNRIDDLGSRVLERGRRRTPLSYSSATSDRNVR